MPVAVITCWWFAGLALMACYSLAFWGRVDRFYDRFCCGAMKAINRDTFTFRGNGYSKVAGYKDQPHVEPGMQMLDEEETLRSLIKRFDPYPEIRNNFDKMHQFLMGSRYWSELESAL